MGRVQIYVLKIDDLSNKQRVSCNTPGDMFTSPNTISCCLCLGVKEFEFFN